MKISIELTIQWQTGHGHEACVWWAKPQSPVKWDVTIFVRVGLYCMIREQHSLTIMHILKAVRALDPNNFSSCKVVCVRRMLFVLPRSWQDFPTWDTGIPDLPFMKGVTGSGSLSPELPSWVNWGICKSPAKMVGHERGIWVCTAIHTLYQNVWCPSTHKQF